MGVGAEIEDRVEIEPEILFAEHGAKWGARVQGSLRAFLQIR